MSMSGSTSQLREGFQGLGTFQQGLLQKASHFTTKKCDTLTEFWASARSGEFHEMVASQESWHKYQGWCQVWWVEMGES